MASIWEDYCSITKRLLLLCGLWPYQKKRTRLFRVHSLTLIIFSQIAPQVAQFFLCDGNARCIKLTIPMFLLMITFLVKLSTWQFNSSKIKSLIDHIYDDWEMFNSVEEYEIMKKYATNAKLISMTYFILCLCVCQGYTLFSFMPKLLNIVLPLNESRPVNIPYQAYYFVDEEKYYFYILFHIIGCGFICVMMTVGLDCTFFIYIEHVCSLFALTGFHLESLSLNDHNDANNRLDDRKIYNRKIAISIHTHWRALRFAEILEDIFCISFAIQMVIVTITLSITLLQVALLYGEMHETVKYLGFIFAQVAHTFCFSVQGQRLIDHSLQLNDNVYNSSWYEIPAELRRLLLFVMRRSMQPCFLTAGKLYIFSLKSFSTVMQSSVSYFTVLASFQ